MYRYLAPFFVFAGLVVLFVFGLHNDPKLVPSPFIDKPIPVFELPGLRDPSAKISSDSMKGEVALLNVWATWCIPCRQEHPLLVDLAGSSSVKIYGLNYKDVRDDAIVWLEKLGDPYQQVFFDEEGKTGIDLGVYGVPETFVLDAQGIVRYKHIGPLTADIMRDVVRPIISELQASSR
jgi:cytochrome c biogenesis protein CcmG, thiol:disulfide interchange protein DsbE